MHFAQKSPKGFGKFFGKDGESTSETPKSTNQPEAPKDTTPTSTPTPTPTNSSSKQEPPKPTFKLKFGSGGSGSGGGGNAGGGSGGGPFSGRSDKEKMFLIAGLVVGGAIGYSLLGDIIYQEIGWQEFVQK